MRSLFLLAIALICVAAKDCYAHSNQSLQFDGQNDRVMIDHASSLIANSNAFSITGWFNNAQLGYGQGMIGFRSGPEAFYLLQLNNGEIECRFVSTTGLFDIVAPANSVVANTWQHYAFTFGNNTLSFYIDGMLINSIPASGTITDSTLAFGIGGTTLDFFSFFYEGLVDEVTLWKKELSPVEINDMINNELTGLETDLMLYYKFDQGTPGQDNSNIKDLYNYAGVDGRYFGRFENMELTGSSSNFTGAIATGDQWIDFPPIGTRIIDEGAFELNATASSGLNLIYSVQSGPATVSGSTVTPTGAGNVVIAANQTGNGSYNAASTIYRRFYSADPDDIETTITPIIPYDNANYTIASLEPVTISAHIALSFSETFSAETVVFQIDGKTIPARKGEDGYYYATWTPSSFGSHSLGINVTNNYGSLSTQIVPFNLIQGVSGNTTAVSIDDEYVSLNNTTYLVSRRAPLPCHQGVYNQIIAHLSVSCPPGGCGAWDAIVNIDARGYDGRWIDIIRYITPYGTACSHSIDLTDYASILNGVTEVRISYVSYDNGYVFDLDFEFIAGQPAYNYSYIKPVWNAVYDFGNPANLQPVETFMVKPPDEASAATFKLVASGHGWGMNNTNNAAEFSANTHHVWVNGAETFEQFNWLTCNPNPSSCSPQAGTWYFDRAGWCPGHIAPYFDFDMTPYVGPDSIALDYVFDTSYVDLCHANNPGCVSGVTCDNCNDGFNPSLHVISNLIFYSDKPMSIPYPTGIAEPIRENTSVKLFPNPASGGAMLEIDREVVPSRIALLDNVGKRIPLPYSMTKRNAYHLDLSRISAGIYFIEVYLDGEVLVHKLVVE